MELKKKKNGTTQEEQQGLGGQNKQLQSLYDKVT